MGWSIRRSPPPSSLALDSGVFARVLLPMVSATASCVSSKWEVSVLVLAGEVSPSARDRMEEEVMLSLPPLSPLSSEGTDNLF